MSEKDIAFLQGILNDILRYITKAEIENENRKNQFKVVYVNPEKENQA